MNGIKVFFPIVWCLHLYINLAWVSKVFIWVSVFFNPIHVNTGKPIRPKICVGPHVGPVKVYESSKFQINVSMKIRFSLNF